jgi:hypothetical protein
VHRQDIVFTDTPNRKCTSNDQPWTAARSQPPSKSVAPGTYSGYGITFLVPAGAGSVLDFSVGSGYLRVNCVGGGAYQTPIKVPKAPIRPDRSFTATISQSGVLNGVNARWTYSVTGRFQGTDSAGRATASGVHRQDIVFTDTPNR